MVLKRLMVALVVAGIFLPCLPSAALAAKATKGVVSPWGETPVNASKGVGSPGGGTPVNASKGVGSPGGETPVKGSDADASDSDPGIEDEEMGRIKIYNPTPYQVPFTLNGQWLYLNPYHFHLLDVPTTKARVCVTYLGQVKCNSYKIKPGKTTSVVLTDIVQ
jgi:hypothetical protein